MCIDCKSLQSQVQALLAENEAMMERYQIVEAGRYAAERHVRKLKAELNGSTSPESQKVRVVCDYHDELWRKTFPNARGLSYPMDGKNAAAVRKVIRWNKDVDEIKRVLDGAFASEFHRSKTTYLTLESILRDENRIRAHLERADEFVSVITGEVMAPETITALQGQRAKHERTEERKRVFWEQREREDPAEAVLSALTRGGFDWRVSGRDGWVAQCPAHNGEDLKLSIDWNGAGDKLLLKCWSHGCEVPYVVDALGLPLSSLFRDESMVA